MTQEYKVENEIVTRLNTLGKTTLKVKVTQDGHIMLSIIDIPTLRASEDLGRETTIVTITLEGRSIEPLVDALLQAKDAYRGTQTELLEELFAVPEKVEA